MSRSPHIIVPGVVPPAEISQRGFGIGFGQHQANAKEVVPIAHTGADWAARDLLVGNKLHAPWAVALTIMPHRIAVEPVYVMAYVRVDGIGNASSVAMRLWEKVVKTDLTCYPDVLPGAEYPEVLGEQRVCTLDDQDFFRYYADAVRYWKKDAEKYPLVVLGDVKCPFFFCSPRIFPEDFRHLQGDVELVFK